MDVANGPSDAFEVGAIQLPLQLQPSVHRRLAQWCRETARLLDTSGVARADVIEALIDHLVNDPGTSQAIRRRLDHLVARPATD
ncbi:MAG TPA: hypothetical protein VFE65_37115 [Pseudonocardia sp.]|nr:hypothetical protein [Pseudonocardia sp.]